MGESSGLGFTFVLLLFTLSINPCSRSGATVAAFLMKENLWTMEKALAYTVERREIVNPNKGFMRQLVEYEGILNAR